MHFRTVTVFAAAFNGFTILLDKAGASHVVINVDCAVIDDMTVTAQLAEGVGVAGVNIDGAVILDHRIGFGI